MSMLQYVVEKFTGRKEKDFVIGDSGVQQKPGVKIKREEKYEEDEREKYLRLKKYICRMSGVQKELKVLRKTKHSGMEEEARLARMKELDIWRGPQVTLECNREKITAALVIYTEMRGKSHLGDDKDKEKRYKKMYEWYEGREEYKSI